MYRACSFIYNYSCIIYSQKPQRPLTASSFFFFTFPWANYLEKESTQMLKWLKLVPV